MTEVDLEPVRHHVEVLRLTKRKIAELKELSEDSKAAIEQVMGDYEIGLLDGEPAIQWPHFKENRFDSAAFREEYPEQWERFKAMREKRRFDVV